jgi:hypothetical protein
MVYSNSTRAASSCSIVNRASGGGSKKAGLPPTANISSNTYSCYKQNSALFPLAVWRRNTYRMSGCPTRPLGGDVRINMR